MYLTIYLFVVPRARAGEFIALQREATPLYLEHGCIETNTYRGADMAAKYGCGSYVEALKVLPEEELFVSIDRWHDHHHHDAVMAGVNGDARAVSLYERGAKMIDFSRSLRAEFEEVV